MHSNRVKIWHNCLWIRSWLLFKIFWYWSFLLGLNMFSSLTDIIAGALSIITRSFPNFNWRITVFRIASLIIISLFWEKFHFFLIYIKSSFFVITKNFYVFYLNFNLKIIKEKSNDLKLENWSKMNSKVTKIIYFD